MQRAIVAFVIALSAFGAAACTGNTTSTGSNNHSSAATASVASADSCGAPSLTTDNSSYTDVTGVVWYSPADNWTYTPGVDDGSSVDEGTDNPAAATDDGSTDANTPPSDPPPPPPPPPVDDGAGSGDDSGSDSWPDTFHGNEGCFPCAVVCVTADSSQTSRTAQASATSYADACSAAVGAIKGWAHHSMHQPLGQCARLTVR